MPVTVYPPTRRLSAVESPPRVARMLDELSEPSRGTAEEEETAEDAALVAESAEKDETASFFAEAAGLPFTHDLARGNLCAFVAGRADEADLCKVTARSILSFNPGMRVAVVTEDAGLGDYER